MLASQFLKTRSRLKRLGVHLALQGDDVGLDEIADLIQRLDALRNAAKERHHRACETKSDSTTAR